MPTAHLEEAGMYLLDRFLKSTIKVGLLTVVDAHGCVRTYGADDEKIKPVIVKLKKRRLGWTIPLSPEMSFGEAYMNGDLEIKEGSLEALLTLAIRNVGLNRSGTKSAFARFATWIFQRLTQMNSERRASHNVAHHYDLSRELYETFLDPDFQYSCAYFRSPELSLEDAQLAKKAHIAAKLLLNQGQRVLDIGSGWGGLALYLAERHAAVVDGVTLSQEQLTLARRRVDDAGLSSQVRFRLEDYRHVEGSFDRIVSVGMFEHVGVPYYHAFFKKVRSLLAEDGVALIHAIGSVDGPFMGSPWIRKYIFPGGYVPALSEVLPAVEASGLILTDVEILRLHYAETLRCWRNRFLSNWANIAHLYDDRFRRMWEFYLTSMEIAFREGGLMVFQLQLARALATVPLTRDYIRDAERDIALCRKRNARRQAA
jgi:cyclopropane-fatty-acyl-phospholipid synthase